MCMCVVRACRVGNRNGGGQGGLAGGCVYVCVCVSVCRLVSFILRPARVRPKRSPSVVVVVVAVNRPTQSGENNAAKK